MGHVCAPHPTAVPAVSSHPGHEQGRAAALEPWPQAPASGNSPKMHTGDTLGYRACRYKTFSSTFGYIHPSHRPHLHCTVAANLHCLGEWKIHLCHLQLPWALPKYPGWRERCWQTGGLLPGPTFTDNRSLRCIRHLGGTATAAGAAACRSPMAQIAERTWVRQIPAWEKPSRTVVLGNGLQLEKSELYLLLTECKMRKGKVALLPPPRAGCSATTWEVPIGECLFTPAIKNKTRGAACESIPTYTQKAKQGETLGMYNLRD